MSKIIEGRYTIQDLNDITFDASKGDDGEMYIINPLTEKAQVYLDDNTSYLSVQLQYNIQHIVGSTITNITASTSSYHIRFFTDAETEQYSYLTTNTTTPTFSDSQYIAGYHQISENEKPFYLIVQLCLGSNHTVVSQRVVPITFSSGLVFSIDTSLNQISSQIQDISSNISDLSFGNIGARNYCRYTSDSWSDWKSLSNSQQTITVCTCELPEDKNVGDKFTTQITIEFSSVEASNDGTFRIAAQAKRDDNVWQETFFNNQLFYLTSESDCADGVYKFTHTYTVTENNKNTNTMYYSIRVDYALGSLRWKCLQTESGDYATGWQPNPKDIDSSIVSVTNLYSEISQSVSDINLIVSNHTTSIDSINSSLISHEDQIGALQVRADSIDASVTRLNSSVSGNEQSISDLLITADMINSSVGKIINKSQQNLADNSSRNPVEIDSTTESGEYYLLEDLEANVIYTLSIAGEFTQGQGGDLTIDFCDENDDSNILSTLTLSDFELQNGLVYHYTWTQTTAIPANSPIKFSYSGNEGTGVLNWFVITKDEIGTTEWISNDNQNITYSYTLNSRITQTASSITSEVTARENGDEELRSLISQTADSITLAIYNEINQQTGINITDGLIDLNADKVNFNGTLNIYNNADGIILYDEYYQPRINIQAKELGGLSDYEWGADRFLHSLPPTQSDIQMTNTSATIEFDAQSIGTYSAGSNIRLHDFRIYLWNKSSDEQLNITSVNTQITIKLGDTTILQNTKSSTYSNGYYTFSDYDSITLSSAGEYTITFKIFANFDAATANTTLYSSYAFYVEHLQHKNILIGLDGVLIAHSQDEYNWIGEDQTLFKRDNYELKISTDGIFRNGIESENGVANSVYSDITSTYPYAYVNSLTYTATMADGYIIFGDYAADDGANRTLYLPFPDTCPGKQYFVKNLKSAACAIRIKNNTNNENLIIDNGDDESAATYNKVINNQAVAVMSCGYYWIVF